jgi:hypothetical protein
LVEAHNVGEATAIAAGGVTFDALDVNTLGSIFTGANPGNITGDASFDAILDSASFATTTVIYTIDGLTAGTTYQAQFFVADSRGTLGLQRTVTVDDLMGNSLTSTTINLGFAFTGVFTATGPTQDVRFSGFASDIGGQSVPYMNAWQLRDVSGTSVAGVPEPATVIIWAGLGLVAAGGVYRRRRMQAA